MDLVFSVAASNIEDTPNSSGLVTQVNALLAPLLANAFLGVSFVAQDNPRALGNEYKVTVTYNDDGDTITHPYLVQGFIAKSLSDLNSDINAFFAANTSYFFSAAFVQSINAARRAQQVVALVFYNTDAADGAANWFAGGGVTPVGLIGYTANNSTALGVGAGTSVTALTGANTAIGFNALNALTSGQVNTAVGAYALSSLIDGNYNTALGEGAGTSIVHGTDNTAIGYSTMVGGEYTFCTAVGSYALRENGNGANYCTAVGFESLRYTSGAYNTAVGYKSGGSNNGGVEMTGTANVAVGALALNSIIGGSNNVALGSQSLRNSAATNNCIAIGYQAANVMTSVSNNIAIGLQSMYALTGGDDSVAVGTLAMRDVVSLGFSVAIGTEALRYHSAGSSYLVAVGYNAALGIDNTQTTGTRNTVVGATALFRYTSGSRDTAVGYNALGNISTGSDNTGVGDLALSNVNTGAGNTAIGSSALGSTGTTASQNVAIGYQAGMEITGNRNTFVGYQIASGGGIGGVADITAVGYRALATITASGTLHTAIGVQALESGNGGARNVAVGYQAAQFVTAGTDNIAVGNHAYQSGSGGSKNVAIGTNALLLSSNVDNNTAVGYQSGTALTSGASNTLVGSLSGQALNTGGSNVAVGVNSLDAATSGSASTAVGAEALGSVTTSDGNTALGWSAGLAITSGEHNTAVGRTALGGITTGSFNIGLGAYAGNSAAAGATHTLFIGETGTAAIDTITIGSDNTYGPVMTTAIKFGAAVAFAAAVVAIDTTLNQTHFTVLADTSGGNITITLPAAPVNGQMFNVANVNGGVNTLTISRNGNNIDGAAADLTTTVTNTSYTLQFATGFGWKIL